MQFIEYVEIEGFRGLSNLRVGGLGRVNLITGKNNSGKSSFLEAIRLLASGGALPMLREILEYREGLSGAEGEGALGRGDLLALSTLFTGCPDLGAQTASFEISARGNLPQSIAQLKLSSGWFFRKFDAEQGSVTVTYEPASADLFGAEDLFPGLDLRAGGRKRIVPLERLLRRPTIRAESEMSQVPTVYLDPFSSRSTSQLGAMWDAIALTDAEREIVGALRVISRDIEAISMIGSDDRYRRRTAIAKSARFANPIPLRTFGDGINRLFGVILSLCNARNGILLIDELENGLHYSVQYEVWRTIFRLARVMNVQIFATSHSWDCVQSFQAAAAESEQEGVLLRLTKRGDDVIPTVFSERELAIASRDQVEVR
ncbi:AAA family ATPase [Lysobacter soli]|uniref:AAA family ATPase n=1 Tax=Lysobacter soli TaxID=453783 RepID=UPI0020A053E0|nr:ATP-binding protein [Lysobacter soli]UTA52738.1 AAA family ATPase [Lysobacter soli]